MVTDIFVVIVPVTSPGDNQTVINDKQAACESWRIIIMFINDHLITGNHYPA